MTIFFYLPLSILTILQLAIVYKDKFNFLDRYNLNNTKAICIFLILFILLGNNGRAIYAMVWEAPHYNTQLNSRYAELKKFDGKDAIVDELKYKPKSIFYTDIESDPKDAKNQSYAGYFHLKSISKKKHE